MELRITIRQHGKKSKTIVTKISDNYRDLNAFSTLARKLWDAERFLNTILGSDLSINIRIVDTSKE